MIKPERRSFVAVNWQYIRCRKFLLEMPASRKMEKHQNLSLWKWIDEETYLIVFYCQMYVNNGNLLQKLTEKVTKLKILFSLL